MKKVLIAVILSAALLLAACGGKPDDMNQDTYDLGCKALTVVEKYNEAEISEEEALDRLDSIAKSIENLDIDDEVEKITNNILRLSISVSVSGIRAGTQSMFDLEKELKESLNK